MSHPQEEGSSQLVQHPVREPPDELSYLFHSTVWLMLCVNRPVFSRLSASSFLYHLFLKRILALLTRHLWFLYFEASNT